MTFSSIQNSFVSGEISPSLFGRTDLSKWHNAASTMRNFFANYRGGASSRAGLAYVGTCKQVGDYPCRDIRFQFSINQGYALEFGDSPFVTSVTGTSNNGAGAIRLTLVSTSGLVSGLTMVVTGVGGTTEANGTWIITVIDGTNVDLIGSAYTNAYTSGGVTTTQAGYMRIKSNGAYVIESTKNITAATNSNPLVITSAAHGYVNGDWIFITGMGGMTELNGLTWIVANATTNTYQLLDLFGNFVNSSSFPAYTSGGTSARIYTIPTPYLAVDIQYLKFTQSADTMSLTCVNQITAKEYPPYELERFGATNWQIRQAEFSAAISAPSGLTVTANASTTADTYYSYVITAVDSITGEESIASNAVSAKNNNISIYAGSNSLTWNTVPGAQSYNIYRAVPSYSVDVPLGTSYGYLGSSFGPAFTDSNVIADFTTVPPVHANPFAESPIISITPTSAGSGLTQATIGYFITTSTGDGFAGTPIVVNGGFAGFIISNGGENYAPTDTITITTGNTAATGTYTFTRNPTNGQNIVLNGQPWTFVSGTPATSQTKIGADLAHTLSALVGDLTLSAVPAINAANYTASTTVLTITYRTPGTAGNSYTLAAGTYGGSVSGATLSGGASSVSGATAILTVGPASGTYPGVVAYYQQRRAYANTLNNPDTYYMSQPGAYQNMDSSIPTTASDAITGTPWAQQINGIQFMVPMTGGLVMLTGNGAWNLNGGNSADITPIDQTAQAQAYNGCSATVPPLVVNYDILYVQSKGSIVRDLSYNFFVNIYTGEDKTVLANQLFFGYQIVQWAYAEEPYKIIWAVRRWTVPEIII